MFGPRTLHDRRDTMSRAGRKHIPGVELVGFLLRLDFLLDEADGVADLAVLNGADESLEGVK